MEERYNLTSQLQQDPSGGCGETALQGAQWKWGDQKGDCCTGPSVGWWLGPRGLQATDRTGSVLDGPLTHSLIHSFHHPSYQ